MFLFKNHLKTKDDFPLGMKSFLFVDASIHQEKNERSSVIWGGVGMRDGGVGLNSPSTKKDEFIPYHSITSKT
jgi:hypothetical protein